MIPLTVSLISITLPGVLIRNMGIAVMSYIVLKIFQSYFSIPWKTNDRAKETTKLPASRVCASLAKS